MLTVAVNVVLIWVIGVGGAWLVTRHFGRKQDQLVRTFAKDQAESIREFYVPMLEHQAQRDPEIADKCELLIAELTARARVMDMTAQGASYRAVRDQARRDGIE